jgi:hypothetical protein
MPFTIGVDEKVEPLLNTRIASIKFESTGNVDWALQGFTLEAERVGRY